MKYLFKRASLLVWATTPGLVASVSCAIEAPGSFDVDEVVSLAFSTEAVAANGISTADIIVSFPNGVSPGVELQLVTDEGRFAAAEAASPTRLGLDTTGEGTQTTRWIAGTAPGTAHVELAVKSAEEEVAARAVTSIALTRSPPTRIDAAPTISVLSSAAKATDVDVRVSRGPDEGSVSLPVEIAVAVCCIQAERAEDACEELFSFSKRQQVDVSVARFTLRLSSLGEAFVNAEPTAVSGDVEAFAYVPTNTSDATCASLRGGELVSARFPMRLTQPQP